MMVKDTRGGAALCPGLTVAISFCYNTNGYIPAGFGQIMRGIVPLPGLADGLTIPIRQSISTIAGWIEAINSVRGSVYETLSGEMAAKVKDMVMCSKPEMLERFTFMLQMSDSGLRDIAEQVKNRVLDWACELERAGITGDGQSFSAKEKEAAQHVTFNITNSTIDQLNNAGTNVKR